MLRAFEFAHLVLRHSLVVGDWVVDATVGNGHDTLFLADRVGVQGRVFGFDVQAAALAAASVRVEGLSQVTLIHAGHENLAEHLPQSGEKRLAAVMFNLGYLPGGAKDIVTRPETTLAALEQALAYLKVGGVAALVLYPGHPGGHEEAAAVRAFAQGLPGTFSASHYARINSSPSHPAPELIVIERKD